MYQLVRVIGSRGPLNHFSVENCKIHYFYFGQAEMTKKGGPKKFISVCVGEESGLSETQRNNKFD